MFPAQGMVMLALDINGDGDCADILFSMSELRQALAAEGDTE